MTATSESWTEVQLGNAYDSMVVVATPLYDASEAPRLVRVRNAVGSSFEVSLSVTQSAPTPSVAGEVHYLVVEDGGL